jgi:1-acyl-sn-glycerol-3-phosphate acyltransferase
MRVLVPFFAVAGYAVSLVALLLIPLLVFVARAVTWPFDRNRVVAGRLARFVPIVFSRSFPLWRIRFEGRWPPGRGAYVVVANHQSFLDIFVLCNIPHEMKWIAKRELFRIPMFGWAMTVAGDISLARGDAASAMKVMEKARRYLRSGMSVMIFPEGTRSTDGKLLPFKPGAFKLAIETGVPVLPIAVEGTGQGMPPGGLRVHSARITVRILEPVPTTGLTGRNVRALRDDVRDRIAGALHDRAEAAASAATSSPGAFPTGDALDI